MPSETLATRFALASEIITRALRETRPAPWFAQGVAILLVRSLMAGDHTRLRRQAAALAGISRGGERYYLALSHFLTGDHEQSLALLAQVPHTAVDPADLAILKSQVLVSMARRQEAWQELDQAAQFSNRLKLYSSLADLVTTADEFDQFENLVRRGCVTGTITPTLSLVDCRLKAALRAGQYEFALKLALEDYRALAKYPLPKPKPVRAGAGEKALADLGAVIERVGVPFFLVSGTLLGAMREGRILPHDSDLDIGVWAEEDFDAIKTAIASSGYFYCLPERSPWMLRVRHVNGVAIDIFRHFREDTYWHGGVKAKWHNSPFELKWLDVLGGRYLIPDNFDQYLLENYGNWMQKVVDFDSVFHTPNAEIVNKYECAIHCIKKIIDLDKLRKLNDDGEYSRFLSATFNIIIK